MSRPAAPPSGAITLTAARREVLRHYVLLTLRQAERPLRACEIEQRMACGPLRPSELSNLLSVLVDLRLIHRLPVTPEMWKAFQAQGIRSRPNWVYGHGRPLEPHAAPFAAHRFLSASSPYQESRP